METHNTVKESSHKTYDAYLMSSTLCLVASTMSRMLLSRKACSREPSGAVAATSMKRNALARSCLRDSYRSYIHCNKK